MLINESQKEIAVDIPLTRPSGKIRIKTRSNVFQYGEPFASRQKEFHQRNYVEWQISYDIATKDASNSPPLSNITFLNNKGEQKTLYELSTILYYMRQWDFISGEEISSLIDFLSKLSHETLIDHHPACSIKRTHPVKEDMNGINFSRMILEYPQLVYSFGKYDIIAEITIREKQRAIGVQPMLYFCFPLTELHTHGNPLIGRVAEQKESANFVFNQDNYKIVLEMVKIFGILSEPHKTDIIAILQAIKNAS